VDWGRGEKGGGGERVLGGRGGGCGGKKGEGEWREKRGKEGMRGWVEGGIRGVGVRGGRIG